MKAYNVEISGTFRQYLIVDADDREQAEDRAYEVLKNERFGDIHRWDVNYTDVERRLSDD